MKRIDPAEVVRRVTRSSFVRVRPGAKPKKVATQWIGYLVLESLSAHRRARRDGRLDRFGTERRSLDAAIKTLLAAHVSGGPRSRRVRNLNAILDAWERRRGPRQRLTQRLIGRTPAHRYLRRKSRAKFGDTANDMLRRNVGTRRMVPAEVAIPSGRPAGFSGYRNFTVWLRSVHRVEAREIADDALYLMTASALADDAGNWQHVTNRMQGTGGVVDSRGELRIPEELRSLCDWRLMLPDNASGAGSTATLCMVALMESEQGSRERLYSAFRAAFSTGRLLVSLLQGGGGGPAGFAMSVVSVLVLVLLALDDDDELGTAVFRFDGVLAPNALGRGDREQTIGGVRRGDDYEYRIGIRYSGANVFAPRSIACEIAGPESLTLSDAGRFTQGRYKAEIMSLSARVPVDNIRWTVAPPRAEILDQGQRETAIRFNQMGDYVVNVSAEIEGSHQRVSDTHQVSVAFPQAPWH